MYLFKDLKFKKHPIADAPQSPFFSDYENAIQSKMTFPNGYGISVIRGAKGFYCNSVTYEVGVLHNDMLCYSTPITGDVLGYQTEDNINQIMETLQSYDADQY